MTEIEEAITTWLCAEWWTEASDTVSNRGMASLRAWAEDKVRFACSMNGWHSIVWTLALEAADRVDWWTVAEALCAEFAIEKAQADAA